MASLTLLLGVLFFLLVAATTVIYRFFYAPLHEVNGPPFARFSRLWYFVSICRGKHEKEAQALHRKYGKIVRLAPDQYSIDDPTAMKIIYGHGTNFVKADAYKGFDPPGQPSIFSGRNIQMHARDRKRLHKYYQMSVMTSYEGYVDNCVSLLSRKFAEKAKANQSINLTWWLQCFAFDVIGEITYSRRFGFLDNGEDVDGLVHSVQALSRYGPRVGVFHEFHPAMFMVNALLARLGLISNLGLVVIRNRLLEQWNKLRTDRAEKVLSGADDAASNGDLPKDFLTKFIEANEADPEGFEFRDAVNGLGGNINAGSDTTSITLTAILYHLCLNPDVLQKLRLEIMEHEKAGKISSPMTFKEGQAMEYLQAVIKEALRINPAIGLTLPRTVPAGGATISGHYFPAGTVVGVNAWVAHFNTNVFGADAESFKPERWLKSCNDEASLTQMEQYYLPFGAGSRVCLGRNVSLLEITKVVPAIVKRFDFELSENVLKNGVETENIFFVVPRNMFAKVRERGVK